MAARAWPRPSPKQLEDLRRPSASSRCFSFVSALSQKNGWMWQPAEAEAINIQAPRAKGGCEPGSEQAGPAGLGRPAQAHFGPVRPRLAP
jgi:hypothetical protein